MRTLAVATCLFAGCQDPAVEVEINTFVGDEFARADPELRRETTLEVLEVALGELWGNSDAVEDGGRSNIPHTVHPPTTPTELTDLVVALREGPLDELAGPAYRIAHAESDLWPHLRPLLLAERKAPKGDYRSLLSAIGGDVPNRYGHFARAWKKSHGYKVKLSYDWFSDLLALPRSKVSTSLVGVYRDCVLQTALLQAASRIGRDPDYTPDVVDALLEAAYLHQGTFRDEVGRALVAVGDEAVPHLLRASKEASTRDKDQEKHEVKRANYAQFNLDRMDRLHPSRAVGAVRDDPRLLASVLSTYGEVRMTEAAEILLDFVDDPSPPVRTAARDAFMAYVTGPAPGTVGRSVRLLGGGLGRAAAYLSYRDRAAGAIAHRLALDAPMLLEDPCEVRREDGSVDTACEEQPQRHTEAYFDWLVARRARAQTEIVDAALADSEPSRAVESLNRLLAADPHPTESPRIAAFFEQRAEAARDAGRAALAGQLFRKASMLLRPTDPRAAESLHRQALRSEAAVPELDPRGRAMLRAAAGEPADAEAASEAAPHASVSADPLVFGSKVAVVSLLLFGLGAGFAPVRRRLR